LTELAGCRLGQHWSGNFNHGFVPTEI